MVAQAPSFSDSQGPSISWVDEECQRPVNVAFFEVMLERKVQHTTQNRLPYEVCFYIIYIYTYIKMNHMNI